MSSIGSRLRKIRAQTGLSQTKFGERFGVSKATQVNYETDNNAPDANYLAALHAAGHDITYLVTGELRSDALSPGEAALVHMFRQVDPERQDVVMATLRLMLPNLSRSGKTSSVSEAVHDPASEFRGEG